VRFLATAGVLSTKFRLRIQTKWACNYICEVAAALRTPQRSAVCTGGTALCCPLLQLLTRPISETAIRNEGNTWTLCTPEGKYQKFKGEGIYPKRGKAQALCYREHRLLTSATLFHIHVAIHVHSTAQIYHCPIWQHDMSCFMRIWTQPASLKIQTVYPDTAACCSLYNVLSRRSP
jgi:hypothetical protein